MKPKVYLPVLGMVVATLFLLWKAFPETKREGSPDGKAAAETGGVQLKPLPLSLPAPVAEVEKTAQQTPPVAPVVAQVAPVSPETHPITVEELDDLAMTDNPESLKKILAALTNSDPDIREAAREAAVQFGDASAAPRLRAVAAGTKDLDEKKELLDAADFLELPPLGTPSPTGLVSPN